MDHRYIIPEIKTAADSHRFSARGAVYGCFVAADFQGAREPQADSWGGGWGGALGGGRAAGGGECGGLWLCLGVSVRKTNKI